MGSIESLGTEFASLILSALISDEQEQVDLTPSVSLAEQKRYLLKNTKSLTYDEKKAVGNIIVINGMRSMLNWCSEGTIIDIDALPPNVVKQMYELTHYKLNNRK